METNGKSAAVKLWFGLFDDCQSISTDSFIYWDLNMIFFTDSLIVLYYILSFLSALFFATAGTYVKLINIVDSHKLNATIL